MLSDSFYNYFEECSAWSARVLVIDNNNIDVDRLFLGHSFASMLVPVSFTKLAIDGEFDIIVVGQIHADDFWYDVYKKARRLLAEDGEMFIIRVPGVAHIDECVKNLQLHVIEESSEFWHVTALELGHGSNPFLLDLEKFQTQASEFLDSSDAKITGAKGLNKFYNVPQTEIQELSAYMTGLLGFRYDWHFEYFQSGEPAGLHTDYTKLHNRWREGPNNNYPYDSYLVIGAIIPLAWNCKQPYTVNYHRVEDVPRKMMYRRGEMRYMDTDEVCNYRSAYDFDPEVERYNPPGTLYHREYADLKFHSEYEWKEKSMMIFDTSRWHSSSWFLGENEITDGSVWKRSIIGFGSVDIFKREQ